MSKSRVIDIAGALQSLANFRNMLISQGGSSVGPYVLRVAMDMLDRLPQYEVTDVVYSRIVHSGEASTATEMQATIQSRTRDVLEQIGVAAQLEGLVKLSVNSAPILEDGTRITARASFLTPAGPLFRIPKEECGNDER